jgi:RNA polymerase sigma-70 factor, ECF subfamily
MERCMVVSGPDPQAVEEVQRLFLRHAGLLRGFILALLPDHNLAEDVFQEVFLTLTRKADDFCPASNFLGWARSVARFKVLEHCRSRKSGPHLLAPEALDAVMAVAGEGDDSWEARREALAQCLEELAPRAREILELRYSEDLLPPPEIAARVNWTVNAVNVALSRARKFLQQCTRRRLALTEPQLGGP